MGGGGGIIIIFIIDVAKDLLKFSHTNFGKYNIPQETMFTERCWVVV